MKLPPIHIKPAHLASESIAHRAIGKLRVYNVDRATRKSALFLVIIEQNKARCLLMITNLVERLVERLVAW